MFKGWHGNEIKLWNVVRCNLRDLFPSRKHRFLGMQNVSGALCIDPASFLVFPPPPPLVSPSPPPFFPFLPLREGEGQVHYTARIVSRKWQFYGKMVKQGEHCPFFHAATTLRATPFHASWPTKCEKVTTPVPFTSNHTDQRFPTGVSRFPSDMTCTIITWITHSWTKERFPLLRSPTYEKEVLLVSLGFFCSLWYTFGRKDNDRYFLFFTVQRC